MIRTDVVPFARHGGEKMIYDARMGPVALLIDDKVCVAYQANQDGPAAHPHLGIYDRARGLWYPPRRIGTVPYVNHHFGPILWMDAHGRVHVLYNCHISGKAQGPVTPVHIVAEDPVAGNWNTGSPIAPSISYPRCIRLSRKCWVIYYRVFGHMGYWTYRLSGNGSDNWCGGEPLVDFDRDPVENRDTWAGSYHTIQAANDGKHLHVAFCYWDESQTFNRLYSEPLSFSNRYDLYYLKVNVETGRVSTAGGKTVERPVNRARAEVCRVLSTGQHITNAATMLINDEDKPLFLLPVSGETPHDCVFLYVAPDQKSTARPTEADMITVPTGLGAAQVKCENGWMAVAVANTDSVWSGSHLQVALNNNLQAFLITGTLSDRHRIYGGGHLELWESSDHGLHWSRSRVMDPRPDRLFNNPRPVISAAPESEAGSRKAAGGLVCFGWLGPESLWERQLNSQECGIEAPVNTGEAYLWLDGAWIDGPG